MIRLFSLFCKLFQIKDSADVLYGRFVNDFQPQQEQCPYCCARGMFVRFGSYERNVIDMIDGVPHCHSISVQRVLCRNCSRTHALLPDFIIPYDQYSLAFILHVLAAYFTHNKTVDELCGWAQITPSILYRWKTLFIKHRSLWLTVLEQLAAASCQFLDYIVELPHPSGFLRAFFRKASFSFLQSHENPANSRKAPS